MCATLAVGCASEPGSSASKKTPAVPSAVKKGASGIDAEEAKASMSFAKAVISPWSLDGGKNYLLDNDFYSKLQKEGSDWALDITPAKVKLVDVGGGDNAVALGLNMSIDKQCEYAYLFNVSNQAKARKDISGTVLKIKFYVPEVYAKQGEKNYPVLRVVVRDKNWVAHFLEGDIQDLNTYEIGSGWHTFVIDFKDQTFQIGNAKGDFELNDYDSIVKSVNSIDLNFWAQDLIQPMNEPFYMDWVSFDGLEAAK
jgi:hypothetical protein